MREITNEHKTRALEQVKGHDIEELTIKEAKEQGFVILTSDEDLALYELGQKLINNTYSSMKDNTNFESEAETTHERGVSA